MWHDDGHFQAHGCSPSLCSVGFSEPLISDKVVFMVAMLVMSG